MGLIMNIDYCRVCDKIWSERELEYKLCDWDIFVAARLRPELLEDYD